MTYFITFGNFKNVNLPKGHRMILESALKSLSKQNQILIDNQEVGSVDLNFFDTTSEENIDFRIELPEVNLQNVILQQIESSTENTKIIRDIKDIDMLDSAVTFGKVEKDSSEKVFEEEVQLLKTNTEEKPLLEVEMGLESQSQHQKIDKEKKNRRIIENIEKIKTSSKKKNKYSLYQKLIGLICLVLCLGLVNFFLRYTNDAERLEKESQLYSRVARIESLQKNQGKVDTFSRFFIPVYFKGEISKIDPFLKQNLKGEVSPGESTPQEVKSLLFNSLEKKGGTFKASYIAYVTDGNNPSYKKITLYVKESKNIYDFELVKKPIISKY